MEPKERIIVALDVSDPVEAARLVEQLRGEVGCFKLGLQFMMAFCRTIFTAGDSRDICTKATAYQSLWSMLDGNVFVDGKFHDTPNTAAEAVGEIARLGVKMINVHCLGGRKQMEAAAKAAGWAAIARAGFEALEHKPLILGVTVLTNLGHSDLVQLGVTESVFERANDLELASHLAAAQVRKLVSSLARQAELAGLDGVIVSPLDTGTIRCERGRGFKIVCLGIRPKWSAKNDQERITTPADAIQAGADYLVIGRPITKPPAEIGSPLEAARRIADEIASVA